MGPRILLTHAYRLYEDPAERAIMKPYPPLGILYIASHLREIGIDAKVIDSTFLDRDAHHELVRNSGASIVGIYANLMTRQNAIDLIQEAKAGGAIVVLGGPEPVNYTAEYFDVGADIIVAGEGENTLAELIPALEEQGAANLDAIPGLVFKDASGEIRETPPRAQIRPLDGRPWPARDAIDMQRYLAVWKDHHGASSVSLITSRGCPYTCRWCSHSVYGFSHRQRSPEDVADELEFIRDRYAPDHVWYADDVFTLNRRWLRRYAAVLAERGLHFPFETISREDRLDEDTIRVLAEMGCYRLWIGAESGSQRVLDAMDRRTDAKRMREMIAMLRRYGIRAGTFVIVGYEGEEWRDIDETMRHLTNALPDDVLTTTAYPIKGTPYYADVADRIIAREPWSQSSDRNLSVAGRRTGRFYAHAQQWLYFEVEAARLRQSKPRNLMRMLKLMAQAGKHRAAMYLTRFAVEKGG